TTTSAVLRVTYLFHSMAPASVGHVAVSGASLYNAMPMTHIPMKNFRLPTSLSCPPSHLGMMARFTSPSTESPTIGTMLSMTTRVHSTNSSMILTVRHLLRKHVRWLLLHLPKAQLKRANNFMQSMLAWPVTRWTAGPNCLDQASSASERKCREKKFWTTYAILHCE